MNTRLEQGLRWLAVGAVAATLGCGGTSPTEVAEVNPAGTPPGAVVADPHPPGEDPDCPSPCNQDPITGEITCGDVLDLVTLHDGAPFFFEPPVEACVTRIFGNHRTMTIDLQLPDPPGPPGERLRFDFDDIAWLCPVPGSLVLDPDGLLFTDNWTFRVTPDGHFIGKCVVQT